MDPRQLRTRHRLRETMYRLAAGKPIDQITVAEVAREAGVTRDTVYRHGADPVRLLAGFLGEELQELIARSTTGLPASVARGGTVFDDAERELLAHIVQHAEIYRNALGSRLIGPVRDVLIDSIAGGLHEHLAAHPQIAPSADARIPADLHAKMLVAYASAGTVAAIEEWLRTGDLSEADAAARTVLAASPSWWLGVLSADPPE